MDFSTKLNACIARVETALDQLVPATGTRPTRLHAAMRYSLEAGGKRVRPVLVVAACEACAAAPAAERTTGARPPAADPLPAAVALECVHTYSLIHDDLPCMDDDDLRRGRPTAHRAFDEATALLAGDALLTHAFHLLATAYAEQPPLAAALVRVLGDAAGSRRLIGGQMADLLAEAQDGVGAEELEFIHLNKTAAMIEAALECGGLTAGADEPTLDTLRAAGRHLGLAFQIIDDVLDATADSTTLGKTAGKDARAGKMTFVRVHGIESSRARAATETAQALAALRSLPEGEGREFLIEFATRLLTRGH